MILRVPICARTVGGKLLAPTMMVLFGSLTPGTLSILVSECQISILLAGAVMKRVILEKIPATVLMIAVYQQLWSNLT
jgi:hypothetical protein